MFTTYFVIRSRKGALGQFLVLYFTLLNKMYSYIDRGSGKLLLRIQTFPKNVAQQYVDNAPKVKPDLHKKN